MDIRRRTLPFVALAVAATTALVGPTSPAGAAETATATVGEVTCVENDGTITVTLAASDTDPATFLVLVGGEGGEEVEVAAGQTQDVTTSGLPDGDVSVEAILMTEGGDEVGETLALEGRTVTCDAAPEGPYSNAQGEAMDGCEGTGSVSASNKPIGGNVEDLQPVTFRVTFTPTDDPVVGPPDGEDTGGGEDPVEGGEPGSDGEPVVGERGAAGPEVELATFVLDANNQTYDRTFSAEELGSTGDLVLWADGQVIASAHVGYCLVVAVESGAGGGPAVVNAGA